MGNRLDRPRLDGGVAGNGVSPSGILPRHLPRISHPQVHAVRIIYQPHKPKLRVKLRAPSSITSTSTSTTTGATVCAAFTEPPHSLCIARNSPGDITGTSEPRKSALFRVTMQSAPAATAL